MPRYTTQTALFAGERSYTALRYPAAAGRRTLPTATKLPTVRPQQAKKRKPPALVGFLWQRTAAN